MRLRQGLASLIWVAILVIAAQFAATSSFAHAGHSRDHVGPSPSSIVHALHTGTSISKRQAAAAEKAELTLTSSPRADNPAPAQTGGCTGGCCGNGIGCCGAAIAAVCSSLPDFRDPQAPIPLVSHSSSGIDPDALRRPPRTLA
jgi:hypothetical protein